MNRDEFLVSTPWLAEHREDAGLRVVDMRYYLREVIDADGKERFLEGHIPGAVHIDWIDDISDPDDPVRGQLAGPERFAAAMERAGIGDETLVIAYDDNHVPLAARLRWALKLYGHDNVRLLDGGLGKWIADGRPLETGPARPVSRGRFTPRTGADIRADKGDVLQAVEAGDTLLLDCRFDPTWYAAGAHIPGARRLPGVSFLGPDGTWLPEEAMRKLVENAGVPQAERVITYCGAGLAATGTWMALEMLGYDGARMYDGSWDEWARYPELPRESHPGPAG